jgi:hypothetical protein
MTNAATTCAVCTRPIHYATNLRSWVHSQPLSQLVVSVEERNAVLDANTERGHGPLRTYDHIHSARPERDFKEKN